MPTPQHKQHNQLSIEHKLQLQEIHNEIDVIKNNHLAHLAADVVEVKTELKNHKDHFNQRLDRLDNRIWAIMVIAVTTLLGVVLQQLL